MEPPDDSWRQGTLAAPYDTAKKVFDVKDPESGKSFQVTVADLYLILNRAVLEEDLNDLLMLSELSEATLL